MSAPSSARGPSDVLIGRDDHPDLVEHGRLDVHRSRHPVLRLVRRCPGSTSPSSARWAYCAALPTLRAVAPGRAGRLRSCALCCCAYWFSWSWWSCCSYSWFLFLLVRGLLV